MKIRTLILSSLAALTLNAAPEDQINAKFFSLQKLANEAAPDENVILSPYSMQQAVGMLSVGAKGDTAEQIKQALGFPDNTEEWFVRNQKELAPEKQSVFTNYNAVVADRRLEMKPEFIQKIGSIFCGKLMLVEFSKPSLVIQILNRIIQVRTKGVIQNALSDKDLDPDMLMTLVNVLHFKDSWQYKFNVGETSKETFTSADGKEIKVDLMFQKVFCQYFRDEQKKVHGVILPYKDARFELVALMPTDKDSKMTNLLQALSEGALPGWLKSANNKNQTILFLPKMNLSAKQDLSSLLYDSGMENAFSLSKADFSGIVSDKICVDKVLQMVKLDINETGTEAAAVTIALPKAASAPRPAVEITNYFCADRPFCLILHYKPTGAILISGVINRLP